MLAWRDGREAWAGEDRTPQVVPGGDTDEPVFHMSAQTRMSLDGAARRTEVLSAEFEKIKMHRESIPAAQNDYLVALDNVENKMDKKELKRLALVQEYNWTKNEQDLRLRRTCFTRLLTK